MNNRCQAILNEIIEKLTIGANRQQQAICFSQVKNFFNKNENELKYSALTVISILMSIASIYTIKESYNNMVIIKKLPNHTGSDYIKDGVLLAGSLVSSVTFIFICIIASSYFTKAISRQDSSRTDANNPLDTSAFLLKNINEFSYEQKKIILALCRLIAEKAESKIPIETTDDGNVIQNPITGAFFFKNNLLTADEKEHRLMEKINAKHCLDLLKLFMNLTENEPNLLNNSKMKFILEKYDEASAENNGDVNERTPLKQLTIN
jgi:hypothetical protein